MYGSTENGDGDMSQGCRIQFEELILAKSRTVGTPNIVKYSNES